MTQEIATKVATTVGVSLTSALHKVACLPVWGKHVPLPFSFFSVSRVPLPQYTHPDIGKIIVRPWTRWAWCAISKMLKFFLTRTNVRMWTCVCKGGRGRRWIGWRCVVNLQCVSTRIFLSSAFLFCTAFFSTPYLVQIQVTFRRKKNAGEKRKKRHKNRWCFRTQVGSTVGFFSFVF